ncbi:MAG: LysM peptidoglycan-binding domain-containing protein [Acidimicrobiales bacterium]
MAIAALGDEECLESPWPRPVLRLVGPAEAVAHPAAVADPVPRATQKPLNWVDVEPLGEPASPADPYPAARIAAARRPQRRSQALRRRRAALGVLVVGLLVALAAPVSALGGRPVSTGVPAGAVAPPVRAHATVYVVRPGDSLSSIAARFSPGPSGRSLAGVLATELGTNRVFVGERLVLP